MKKKDCKAYGTKAQGDVVVCEKCINGFQDHENPQMMMCMDIGKKYDGKLCRKDFSCGYGVLRGSTVKVKPEPSKEKVFLDVAHYRTVEIDKAEMEGLVNTIKSNGADTCEYTITNAFFRFTKSYLEGNGRCLDNSEVMTLWKQFKTISSSVLKKGGAHLC